MDCVRTWAAWSAITVTSCSAPLVTVADTLPAPLSSDPKVLAWEEIQGVLDPAPGVASRVDEGAEIEVITERYSNRAVKIERHVALDDQRNYVNHGPWKMWDRRGQLLAEGQYRHGQRHGKWTRVLPQLSAGQRSFAAPFKSEAVFAEGQLHGIWSITDTHGRPFVSWEFRRGQLHGTMIGWHAQGQKKFEASFAEGLPHGEAVYWTSDGRERKKEYYQNGNQRIPSVGWYDAQQKEAAGWMIRTNLKFDVQLDWWQGVLTITRDESESQDVKTGTWNEWYPNGTPRFTGSFKEGQPAGTHTWWHPNGQKMMIGEYQTGVPEGLWTRWHTNGRKQQEGSYLAGNMQGTWTVWDENGVVTDARQPAQEDEVELNRVVGESHNVAFPQP